MNVWLAISLILAVAAIYLFMIEVFSVAFKLTGLATNKIKFQVASLFTASGFTTQESELITNDDRRRRIAVTCMYTGHIFSVVIMGLIINVLISIGASINADRTGRTYTEWCFIVFYISAALFLLVLIIKIPPINKALTKKYALILLSLRRGNRRVSISKDTMLVKGDVIVAYGHINDIREAFVNSVANKKGASDTVVVDNTNEIQLINNYGANTLMEVTVHEVPKELDGIKMKDSHLTDRYSINIVIIKRDNEYISADKDTIIQKGDIVTLFGPYINIKHLFNNEQK